MPKTVWRLRVTTPPAKGIDHSIDLATLADSALAQGINVRVAEGIYVSRGGCTKASDMMESSVVGLIETTNAPPAPPILPWGLVGSQLSSTWRTGGDMWAFARTYDGYSDPYTIYAFPGLGWLRVQRVLQDGSPRFDKAFVLNDLMHASFGDAACYLYELTAPGTKLEAGDTPAPATDGTSTLIGTLAENVPLTSSVTTIQAWGPPAIREESGVECAYWARATFIVGGVPYIEAVKYDGEGTITSDLVYTSGAELGLGYPANVSNSESRAAMAWAAGDGLVVTAYEVGVGPVVRYQQTPGGAWATATDADTDPYFVAHAAWFGGYLYMLVGPDNYTGASPLYGVSAVPVRIKKMDLATGVISTLVSYPSGPLDGKFVVHESALYLVRRTEAAADAACHNFGIYKRVNDTTWTRIADGGDGTTFAVWWAAESVNGEFLIAGEWAAYDPEEGVTGDPVTFTGSLINSPEVLTSGACDSAVGPWPPWAQRIFTDEFGAPIGGHWGRRGVYSLDPDTLVWTKVYCDNVTNYAPEEEHVVAEGEVFTNPVGTLAYLQE